MSQSFDRNDHVILVSVVENNCILFADKDDYRPVMCYYQANMWQLKWLKEIWMSWNEIL